MVVHFLVVVRRLLVATQQHRLEIQNFLVVSAVLLSAAVRVPVAAELQDQVEQVEQAPTTPALICPTTVAQVAAVEVEQLLLAT